MAALGMERPFQLRTIRQVSPHMAVAAVQVGPVIISSIWITDIQHEPEVSWPRSTRGFPIAAVEDDKLRREIEAAILDVVGGWRNAGGAA